MVNWKIGFKKGKLYLKLCYELLIHQKRVLGIKIDTDVSNQLAKIASFCFVLILCDFLARGEVVEYDRKIRREELLLVDQEF
jgi:hypothetical protein